MAQTASDSLGIGPLSDVLPEFRARIASGTLKSVSAKWVFPVVGPPVEFGRIELLEDGLVGAIGALDSSVRSQCDFPQSALLPRLVNLHAHLELTEFDEPIGRGLPLPEWAPEVVKHRQGRGGDGLERGLHEVVRWGTSTVVDIVQPGDIGLDRAESCGAAESEVRRIACLECIGLSEDRIRTALENAKSFLDIDTQHAISPHAPYSVAPDLLQALVDLSRGESRLVTMHVAESPAERQLLEAGTGPFRDMLEGFGAWNPELFGGRSVEEVIRLLRTADRCVVAHGNDLRPSEYRLFAGSDRHGVAYCSRTHDYFGYDRHPFMEMLDAGVLVGLGTDSRASNQDLSVWGEVTFLAAKRKDVSRRTLIEMATLHGAKLLGLDARVASIQQGSSCDMLVVPLARPDATDPYEALLG